MLSCKIKDIDIIDGKILHCDQCNTTFTLQMHQIHTYTGFYTLLLRNDIDENTSKILYYKNNIINGDLNTGCEILPYLCPDIYSGDGYMKYTMQFWKQDKRAGTNLLPRLFDLDSFLHTKQKYQLQEQFSFFIPGLTNEVHKKYF